MTYDELIAYAPLALIMRNRDTVAEMPEIVRRAHDYLVRVLDHDLFRQTFANSQIGAGGIVSKVGWPDGVMEIRSVATQVSPGTWLPLMRRSEEMLIALYSDANRGAPRYYAVMASGEVQVFPAPGVTGKLARVTANVRPPTLSASQQENVISQEFPSLVEYATCYEAAVFNVDPMTAELYKGRTEEALLAANAQISRRTRDESAQRAVETRNIQGG